jgi:hypothetical protein
MTAHCESAASQGWRSSMSITGTVSSSTSPECRPPKRSLQFHLSRTDVQPVARDEGEDVA